MTIENLQFNLLFVIVYYCSVRVRFTNLSHHCYFKTVVSL